MGSGDSATLLVYLLIALGYVWVSLALTAVFNKVGEPKAQAWIPVWNLAVVLRIGGYAPWLILIPLVNVVLLLIACHRIGVAFGYGPAMTVVAALWFPIWASVLGWGNAIWSGVVKTPSRVWADEPTPLPRMSFADEPTDPIQPAAAVPTMMAEEHLHWGEAEQARPDDAVPELDVIHDLEPAKAAKEGDDMTDSDVEQTPEPSSWTPVPQPSTPITAVDLVAAAFDRPFDDDFGIERARTPKVSQPAPQPSPQSPPAKPESSPEPQETAEPPVVSPAPAPAPAPQPEPPAEPVVTDPPRPRRTGSSVVEETTELDQTMLASRFRQSWAIVGRNGESVELTGNTVVVGRKPSALRAHPEAQLLVVPDSSRTVSKAHAVLHLVRGVWMVRDLGSTNGVILIGADGTERLLEPDREEPLTERFFLGDAEFALVSNA